MDQLHMRHPRGDHTVSLRRDREGEVRVSVEPDDPLAYGHDGASARLDDLQVRRLRWWLATGKAVPATSVPPDLSEESVAAGADALRDLFPDTSDDVRERAARLVLRSLDGYLV